MMFTWEETEHKIYQQERYLRFGTNASLGGMLFYPSFRQLYETYPDLSITMKTGATNYIEDEVLQGNLDIAYVLGYPKHKNLQYIHKADEHLVLIGKNVLNHDNIADCIDRQNILFASEDCCCLTTLQAIYNDYQVTKGELTHIYDYEALIQFTQLGMGVSIVAKSLVEKHKIQHYMELPEQYRNIGLYLIARQDHGFTSIEKQFIGLNDKL